MSRSWTAAREQSSIRFGTMRRQRHSKPTWTWIKRMEQTERDNWRGCYLTFTLKVTWKELIPFWEPPGSEQKTLCKCCCCVWCTEWKMTLEMKPFGYFLLFFCEAQTKSVQICLSQFASVRNIGGYMLRVPLLSNSKSDCIPPPSVQKGTLGQDRISLTGFEEM